ncbi:MAG: efflux transporter outer membrane subunit [Desulfovibrionales bacterium]|nr:efflux transporter outer membrane subunit [Desulfovibrionales bacterium]
MHVIILSRAFFLLCLVILASCAAVGPDYTPPAMAPPAGWTNLDTSARPVTHPDPVADISQWWENLDDPLLIALVEEALLNSPDVRSAQAKLWEARARRGVAVSEFFPNLAASGNARRSQSSKEVGSGTTRELFNAGFDAAWELDLFGGVRRSVEAAGASFESSIARLHDAQVTLTAEVGRNYMDFRTVQLRLRIARENLATQSETLQLTEWRAQAGLVSSQDVEQARGNLEQTRAQIPNLETSLAEAGHRLDVLLGQTPGTLQARLTPSGDLPAVPEGIAVGIPADILRQRPDVRAAERTLAAETARIGAAEAARYPAFNLSGTIGFEALSLGALGSSGTGTSSLLAGISAPIFDAGRLRGQVEIQNAVREQALVAYEQVVLEALEEVENALVALARNRERVRALANAVEAERNAAEMARQRYSSGLIDFQSVLDTERSVLSVEDNLATARADGVLTLISLYKALGGGWSWQTEAARPERTSHE